MNGIHDLGGMAGFGPVLHPDGEPVFHTDWERRVFAINLASLAFLGPIDRARHAVERMDAVEYLNTSYYEHWLAGVVTMSKDLGYATDEEFDSGQASGGNALPHPPPDAEMIEGLVRGGLSSSRDEGRLVPRFKPGDTVRARNLEITGHTRLVRYIRGKAGVIQKHHGSHVFPDTSAHDLGENAQPLYSVRFEARELWGENVERRDCVYIDLWEDYLEPVGEG